MNYSPPASIVTSPSNSDVRLIGLTACGVDGASENGLTNARQVVYTTAICNGDSVVDVERQILGHSQ